MKFPRIPYTAVKNHFGEELEIGTNNCAGDIVERLSVNAKFLLYASQYRSRRITKWDCHVFKLKSTPL